MSGNISEWSLDAIKQELRGHQVFDDPCVFERLHINRTSSEFVDRCKTGFYDDPRVVGAKQKLEGIVTAAREMRKETTDDEDEDSVADRKARVRKARVRKMYKPLSTIFEYIETLDAGEGMSSQFKNTFQSADEIQIESDGTMLHFPLAKPTFTLLEFSPPIPPTPQPHRSKHTVVRRQQAAFCEVMASEQHSPKYTMSLDAGNVKPIVAQAAYHARLHLTTRPFQLFSVVLLIFGLDFCVAIFDRGGLCFSPIHKIFADPEKFICVVRAMTHQLSPEELGRDPTVTELSEKQHQAWLDYVESSLQHPIDRTDYYPTFQVKDISKFRNRTLLTIGKPIWSSLTLLGRGTSVWLMADKSTRDIFVLKTAWRKGSHKSESQIYSSIKGEHPALAKFESGGDVMFPGTQEQTITVNSLRQQATKRPTSQDIDDDVILHRLILRTRGRSILQWTSYKELLLGIRAAVSAHEFLWKQGILHRDISAGNVMLSIPGQDENGAKGFLMDVELSHILNEIVPPDIMKDHIALMRGVGNCMTESSEQSHLIFEPPARIKCRGAMSGTALFMATETLQSIVRKEAGFVPKVHHDIESFVYVLIYATFGPFVLQKSRLPELPQEEKESLTEAFHRSFGQTMLKRIMWDRQGVLPTRMVEETQNHVPPPLTTLFNDLTYRLLEKRLALRQSRKVDEELTHTYLIGKLDEAVALLQDRNE
ncbi:hypothetical protein CPB84DRAFT_1843510 [Gymnopilus junonius]|uniref:Protein kinase domain-containing protein n=1 Tax=Gymnopilus junonius TaxID=109634 RepID=A0A9P5NW20_GYMJU|nr:hypothetical protein CPB84DRAFT_1843510 [Gymnopilus junonius]